MASDCKVEASSVGLEREGGNRGGFCHPPRHLEKAIQTARQEAATAKRVLFLGQSQRVFHLWHVVHRPFSYTFALLALSTS